MAPFIGAPYGACFEVNNRDLVRTPRPCEVPADWSAEDMVDDDRNNAGLGLGGEGATVQGLSKEEIDGMKASGIQGSALVAALTAASATFSDKTAFAQAKYVRRKARKHVLRAVLVRPTGRTLAALYASKGGAGRATVVLRPDTLALLLNAAGVGAGAHALVVDGVGGVLAAAVVERLGGHGRAVVAAMPGAVAGSGTGSDGRGLAQRGPLTSSPAHEMVRSLHVREGCKGVRETLRVVGLDTLLGYLKDEEEGEDASARPAKRARGEEGGGAAAAPSRATTKADAAAAADRASARAGFDGLIAAAPPVQPGALISACLPLLAPSAPFALACPSLAPAAEAALALQTSKAAVCVGLGEPWWRTHQVLPRRTHPCMSMSGSGGYVVSGTALATGARAAVADARAAAAVQEAAARRAATANVAANGRGGGKGRGGRAPAAPAPVAAAPAAGAAAVEYDAELSE
jgi:tRNA (adenine-N(1)-)-methyltransferase non-catalytic subunit